MMHDLDCRYCCVFYVEGHIVTRQVVHAVARALRVKVPAGLRLQPPGRAAKQMLMLQSNSA